MVADAAAAYLTTTCQVRSWQEACLAAGPALRRTMAYVDLNVTYHANQARALKALVDLLGWELPPDSIVPDELLTAPKVAK
jgi:hypothetical protein